jgi:hypothetical protein
MSILATVALFKHRPTPANAQKLVNHVRKYPMVLTMMDANDMAAHTQAQYIVAAAANNAIIQCMNGALSPSNAIRAMKEFGIPASEAKARLEAAWEGK